MLRPRLAALCQGELLGWESYVRNLTHSRETVAHALFGRPDGNSTPRISRNNDGIYVSVLLGGAAPVILALIAIFHLPRQDRREGVGARDRGKPAAVALRPGEGGRYAADDAPDRHADHPGRTGRPGGVARLTSSCRRWGRWRRRCRAGNLVVRVPPGTTATVVADGTETVVGTVSYQF